MCESWWLAKYTLPKTCLLYHYFNHIWELIFSLKMGFYLEIHATSNRTVAQDVVDIVGQHCTQTNSIIQYTNSIIQYSNSIIQYTNSIIQYTNSIIQHCTVHKQTVLYSTQTVLYSLVKPDLDPNPE